MNSKPLSYDSLKTVLQHMDANTRINLAAHIPSIRKTEKSVPLKINYLHFDSDSISIDKSNYKVGIFRDYGAMKTPNYVKKCNEEGGGSYDIDEYGFEDLNSLKQRSLPEDIVMKPYEIEEPPPRDDNTSRKKEADIVFMKSQVSEDDMNYKFLLSEHGFEKIEDLAEQLHSAQERNDEDRYETLYELTVSRSRSDDEQDLEYEAEQIERVEYRKQLPLALRAISNFIFGGRRHPVHVESLRVEETTVIRVPSDLQLKIRHLDLLGTLGIICNALHPIIHSSSFPLEELEIVDFGMFDIHRIDISYFQSKMARDAEKLTIYYQDNNAWLPILSALQNKLVHMQYCFSMSANDYVELIRTWAVQGKDIGTVFTFEVSGFSATNKVQGIVDRVAEEFEGAVKNERFLTVPMSNRSSRIHVTTTDKLEYEPVIMSTCFLEIKVVSSSDDSN
ncbi:hypothetical protein CAEBREN_20838 [Caenorhabditis brenneri]|uniref:Uncharacterized protein n=1 Tax=Caenorhabditis brenneri TaxID=135651 RepID=G0MMJ8_CAEBE|nr:hypothetical protein CAEBREN_20838 [Caenorhabditis brenneri]